MSKLVSCLQFKFCVVKTDLLAKKWVFSIPCHCFCASSDSVIVPNTALCTPGEKAKVLMKKILVNVRLQDCSM